MNGTLQARRPLTIGLTGGIGSGKSSVARILEESGAAVIHADAVGHEVYQPQTEGWRRVTAAFGEGIVKADQTIDRQKLGTIVFRDPEALKRLNAIVHPLIFAEVQRRIGSLRASGSTQPIVVEAAVLIEANWLPLVDEVWLVVADKQAVIDRLARQRGLAPHEVARRLAAQLSDAERRKVAQVVIENRGSLEELRGQVESIWQRVTAVK
jgi:dephospho-CoA kinase